MVKLPVPKADEWFKLSCPALSVTPPLKELEPDKESAPLPDLVMEAVPLITPVIAISGTPDEVLPVATVILPPPVRVTKELMMSGLLAA